MGEQITFTNSLGTITDKRVILNFKGGTEDVPLKQITSIGYEKKQHYVMAGANFFVAIFILYFMVDTPLIRGANILFAFFGVVCFIIIGIAYYIGNYYLRLGVAGQERPPVKVDIAQTGAGREFVDALRRQIIS